MRTVFRHLSEPLTAIRAEPYQFAVWWLVANVCGLSGLWLPILVLAGQHKALGQPFQKLIDAGTLPSFSVVILAEGIAAMLVAVRSGTNPIAAGIRALAAVLAIVVIFIQVAFLGSAASLNSDTHLSFWIQGMFTLLAIVTASYLFCFRTGAWEKGVESFAVAESAEVGVLGENAANVSKDESDTKL